MKLYDLPQRQEPRPKIYGLQPDGHKNGWIEFDHIDGMYSFCVAYGDDGEQLGVCHLAATTPLEPHQDGWQITEKQKQEHQ